MKTKHEIYYDKEKTKPVTDYEVNVDGYALLKTGKFYVFGESKVIASGEARGKKKWVKNELGVKMPKIISDGKISKEMMYKWIKNKGVKLRGGGTDESPQAYRRLDEVLACHSGTIKIKYTLKPVGVVMCNE